MGRVRPDPVVTGVVGLGNYAGRIINRLLLAERDTDHPPRLVAATSSNPDGHPELRHRLEGHGVEICPDYDALLARSDVEAIWLPVPIDLHLPFAVRALEAGKAVLCEKPITGTVDECDEMIAHRDAHGLPFLVGYQSMYDPATLWLKRRLLTDMGHINSATLHAVWPRDSVYYGRTPWAGRLRNRGTWILDSPLQNAFNHFLNLTLFLLGPNVDESATPASVTAELYRVNEIESYDTISLRVRLDVGPEVLIHLTHAGRDFCDPVIRFDGNRGTATWRFNGETTLSLQDGAAMTRQVLDVESQRTSMVAAFNRRVRGVDDPERTAATLEQARETLVVVNGVSEAAPVNTIPPDNWVPVDREEGARLLAIPDIEHVFEYCSEHHQMLHESGTVPWSVEGHARDLRGYDHFAGVYSPNAR